MTCPTCHHAVAPDFMPEHWTHHHTAEPVTAERERRARRLARNAGERRSHKRRSA